MTKSASQPAGRRRLVPIRPDRRPPARSIRRPDAMDRPSLIAAVTPIMTLVALFTGIALPFIAGSRSGRSHAGGPLARAAALKRIGAAGRKARPPEPSADDAAPAEYLYVPCARIRYHGYPAETRRWVQEVPIVKKTAKWIYYTSDSWDRSQAVVSPDRISRQEVETDTRCHDDCPRDIAAGLVFAPHGRGHRHCVHFLAPGHHCYAAGGCGENCPARRPPWGGASGGVSDSLRVPGLLHDVAERPLRKASATHLWGCRARRRCCFGASSRGAGRIMQHLLCLVFPG